jgi:vacuolar-type H+-ATPase subunit I/STV1
MEMETEEQKQLREIRDRLTKLETTVKLEFKHTQHQIDEVCKSIQKLNEEYGQLINRQQELDRKTHESLLMWKVIATFVSPSVTAVLLWLIRTLLNI